MNTTVSDAIWAAAVRTRNAVKRAGWLGPLDGLTAFLGPRLLPPPRREARVAIGDGLELILPPDLPSYRNYATGLYEVEVTRVISSLLRPGMSFVDAGANVGYYTLLASQLVGPEGHVYSFEPDNGVFDCLTRSVKTNNCSNVSALNMALGDQNGLVSFHESERERGFVADLGAESLQVEQVSMDAFFRARNWPKVDIVKIDVEGGEESVLRGMRELVERNRPLNIIVELNSRVRHGRGGIQSLIKTIESLGFDSGHVIERDRSVRLVQLLSGSAAIYNLLLTHN